MTPRLWSQRTWRLLLAACSGMLLVGYAFFLFVVPLTPVRLAQTSVELDRRLALWRVIRAHLSVGLYGPSLLSAVVVAVFVCFGVYLLAVAVTRSLPCTGRVVAAVVAASVVFTAASAVALPNFDPDVYTYIATGRVAAVHHRDPYAVATDRFPGDPFLKYELKQYTHHPDIKLPAWMPLDVGLAKIAGDDPARALLTYRGALAAFALADLLLVLLVVRTLWPRHLATAAVAWGWNPLVALFGPSKVDIVMAFFVLVAVFALTRAHRHAAVAFLTLATFVKLLAAPFLAVLVLEDAGRRRWRSLALSVVLVLAIVGTLYAPYGHPWALIRAHLNLAATEGAGGTPASSNVRVVFVLLGTATVAALALRRVRPLPELLRVWSAIGVVVGVAVAAGQFPWYLLTFIAVTVVAAELRHLAALSALGVVSLLAFERRGSSTPAHPLPRLSPLSLGQSVIVLVAAAVLVTVVVKLRRRSFSSVPS